MSESLKKLITCIGEIDDLFIEESEKAIIYKTTQRKRIARYGTVAAAASFGIAVTYWFLKSKRLAANQV